MELAFGFIVAASVCGRVDDDQFEDGVVGTSDLHLFAVAGGGEEVVEMRRGVLGADLHGFRVAERGGGVNDSAKLKPILGSETWDRRTRLICMCQIVTGVARESMVGRLECTDEGILHQHLGVSQSYQRRSPVAYAN